jgi:transposase-like protein
MANLYRVYSNEQRAEALTLLKLNGGNIQATARRLGIPRGTLREWAAGRRPPSVDVQDERLQEVAAKFEEVVLEVLDALKAKVNEASVSQLAIAAGISVDKICILRSRPLEIPAAPAPVEEPPTPAPVPAEVDDDDITDDLPPERRKKLKQLSRIYGVSYEELKNHGPYTPEEYRKTFCRNVPASNAGARGG